MRGHMMSAERRVAIACVVGMLLCLAGVARAEPAVLTTAGDITVVVTPEPTHGIHYASWEENKAGARFCGGWFGGPLAFHFLQYPAYQALERNSADWRAMPQDKQRHLVYSAWVGGTFASLVYALPAAEGDGASPLLSWRRLAVVSAICLGPGIAWEARDEAGYRLGERDHGAEAGDLVADAAGCVVGIAAGAAIGMGARKIIGTVRF